MKTKITRMKNRQRLVLSLLQSSSVIRDLTKLLRRRQGERRKGNRSNEQNNNSAHVSRFFVHFFAVPAQLRREMTKF